MNSDIRKKIDKIIQTAVSAVEPAELTAHSLTFDDEVLSSGTFWIDLKQYERVYLVAIGKAAQGMAFGASQVLQERIHAGFVLTKQIRPDIVLDERFTICEGDHPIPGQKTFSASYALKAFLARCTSHDFVLFLISGGGSALMSLPCDDISMADLQEVSKLLLASGARIEEFNAVRKHLDQMKGGRLLKMAGAGGTLTCILSDVVGSPIDVIASGPTVADHSTFSDALQVFHKYDLYAKVPSQVREYLEKGTAGYADETLKADQGSENQQVILLGDNRTAALAAKHTAEEQGFNTVILTRFLTGEARQAGIFCVAIACDLSTGNGFLPLPALVILGGETTVTLHGMGLGGRNIELALGAVEALNGLPNTAVFTLATDGEDGPTDACGAIADGTTFTRATVLGLNPTEFLKNNDSYHFFEKLGDLIRIGSTGTNVNDLTFILVW